MKECRSCGPKPRSEFYARPDSPDGLRNTCKACVIARVGQSPSKVARHEAAVERKANRVPADTRARLAAWYQANKENRLRQAAAWNRKNRESNRARSLRWQRENPEKVAESARRRRAVKCNSDVRKVSDGDLRRLVGRFRGLCAYCQARPWKHFDHVIPLSRGGRHSIGNLLPACQDCNQQKHAKTVMEWMMWRHRHAA